MIRRNRAIHYPPRAVSEAAAKGLMLRHEFGRGGTSVGLGRARQLMEGHPVSIQTLKKMHKFFSRHFKNRLTPPSQGNGKIAWLLWGGNPGKVWARRILKAEGYL